jgi:dihydropteroate synthase
MINPKLTINCRGTLIDLSEPVVMAILNINEDSFYAGSRFTESQAIVAEAGKMLSEGALILDIGGMSSRPGAVVIETQEELDRVLPVIELLHQTYPEAIISVDTIRAEVARQSVAAGAAMVNDISAGRIDPDMYATVARLQVPYILMHMQKRPENMQQDPVYEDVVREVLDFMIREMAALREHGLKDIIIDPGFGFGKSVEHNYTLLRSMHVFQMLDVPVLAGLSRKSMIYKPLNITPEAALNGTSVLHLAALQQGAKILRVHDVAPAVEVIRLFGILGR